MKLALPLFLCLALGLWTFAALSTLPLAGWPAFPWRVDSLSIDQILLAYGVLPRAAVALLAGASLGLAGALMQAVLRNPLADPTTLGTASGAQLALVAATILAPGLLVTGAIPVALAGAAMVTLPVLALGARRGFAPVTVTIAGMLAGMLCSAVATALTLSQGHYLLSLVIWNGGALTQQDWSGAARLALAFAVALGLAVLLARPLVVLSLGTEGARGLGLSLSRLRLGTILIAVTLSALVSAEVGLVGFIGLAAPAIATSLGARTVKTRLLLSPLAGALILSLVDGVLLTIATLGGPTLPAGALTGLIGGPLLLWLLPKMATRIPQPVEDGDRFARRAARPGLILTGLAVAVLVLSGLTLLGGRSGAGWGIVPADLATTFLPLRATAILAALASGALLAGSGAILQRLTANPMAAPEVLGVTGGAALGYAATLFALPAPGPLAHALGTSAGAALAQAALSAHAARSGLAPARVLLAGLAIGALSSAVLGAIMVSDDRRAWLILGWLAGGTHQVTPVLALGLALLALLLLALMLLSGRWLDILPLGPEVAQALGLPLLRLRIGMILLAGFATGAATMLVGPVSFVGLMAPHLARSLGLARAAPFAAGSWLLGALLMVLAAFGARTVAFPYDLPLGLVASLIGAPWLLLVLLRKTRA